jgi:hypothetical protein
MLWVVTTDLVIAAFSGKIESQSLSIEIKGAAQAGDNRLLFVAYGSFQKNGPSPYMPSAKSFTMFKVFSSSFMEPSQFIVKRL